MNPPPNSHCDKNPENDPACDEPLHGHELSSDQILALRCAHADLIGALQAFHANDYFIHDWDAHLTSIWDLEQAFSGLLEPAPEDLEVGSF